MDIYVAFIVIVTTTIQCFFGVGVLLFGTPLLLLLNYTFFQSLLILLPISVLINLIQVSKDYKYFDKKFYVNILKYSVPFIIISLYFVSNSKYNPSIIIGIFLLLIAMKNYVLILKSGIENFFKFNKIYFIVMGTIHGISNLGGSLLIAKVYNEKLNKDEKRSTIAISYLTFAIFQILTILLLELKFQKENFIYIFVGIFVYFIVNKFFYKKLSDGKYNILFTIFLFLSGILLIFKGI